MNETISGTCIAEPSRLREAPDHWPKDTDLGPRHPIHGWQMEANAQVFTFTPFLRAQHLQAFISYPNIQGHLLDSMLPLTEKMCACRSGDNYWEPGNLDITLNATDPVDVRIYCADGQPPKIEPGLIPAQMLCAYQDPGCQPFMGTIQC